jgi:hypothetical protein
VIKGSRVINGSNWEIIKKEMPGKLKRILPSFFLIPRLGQKRPLFVFIRGMLPKYEAFIFSRIPTILEALSQQGLNNPV